MPHHPLRVRSDISDDLIHFVRRESPEEAFGVLEQIVLGRRLLGGTGYIKGAHCCVCFTEAPLDSIAEVVWRSQSAELKYQAFGIKVSKRWLFERGGRPVIYEPDADYQLLPAAFQYRHVRYEPCGDHPIDLTWEREWRINTDKLCLDPPNCGVVVLESEHESQLRMRFDEEQDRRIQEYASCVGASQAEQYREEFPWNVTVIGSVSPQCEADFDANQGRSDQ
jgi:hypothetical protein